MRSPDELRAAFLAAWKPGARPRPEARETREAAATRERAAPSPPQLPAVTLDPTRDRVAEMIRLADAIAAELGDGWHRVAEKTKDGDSRRALLARTGAEKIVLRQAPYPARGRLAVLGDFPASATDGTRFYPREMRYGGAYKPITVSERRSSKEIAREIARRMLPGYLAELAHQVEARDAYDAGVRWREATARELAQIIGEESRSHPWERGFAAFDRHAFEGDPWSVEGKVWSGFEDDRGRSVELKVRCHPDIARELLEVLRDWKRSDARAAHVGRTHEEESAE